MNHDLLIAVNSQCDNDLLNIYQDVSNYGASVGFSGFTYYCDCIEFFNSNKKLILELLIDNAESYGYDSYYSMIKEFRCIDSDITIYDMVEVINNGDQDNDHCCNIINSISWYVLEQASYYLCNIDDSDPDLFSEISELLSE